MGKWTNKAKALTLETHNALQLIWDATNKGQRKKLLKNPEIKILLERYNINIDE